MSKVLFAVSGSIAGIKAAQAVSQLVQRGHEVQIVTTPSALRFVGSATWEGLTGRPVLSDIFAEGHLMDHIHLARWADLLILCPASAHAIAGWALGMAADLPGALYLAFGRNKPILFAPAMNKEMWAHPAVQEHLSVLKGRGARIIEPEEGKLACGENGVGRLAGAETIVAAIERYAVPFSAPDALNAPPSVLITSGGTREPIDQIRFITNLSSGRTGAVIANHFARRGFLVTYLHGDGAQLPVTPSIQKEAYSDFKSLQSKLGDLLGQGQFDAVIQAAAVSDFSVAQVRTSGEGPLERSGGKIGSEQDLVLHLKRNPKLVSKMKEWSGSRKPAVIAFKLTDTPVAKERAQAVDRLLTDPGIDAVVWNDLSGIGPESHSGAVFRKNGTKMAFLTKQELAETVFNLISQEISNHDLGH